MHCILFPGSCIESFDIVVIFAYVFFMIQNAAKREVKEEAGYDCDIVSLISVEFGSGTWWRFNFAGKITGAALNSRDVE